MEIRHTTEFENMRCWKSTYLFSWLDHRYSSTQNQVFTGFCPMFATVVAHHTVCCRVLPALTCELSCTCKPLQNLYAIIKTGLHLNYSVSWTGQEQLTKSLSLSQQALYNYIVKICGKQKVARHLFNGWAVQQNHLSLGKQPGLY